MSDAAARELGNSITLPLSTAIASWYRLSRIIEYTCSVNLPSRMPPPKPAPPPAAVPIAVRMPVCGGGIAMPVPGRPATIAERSCALSRQRAVALL